MMSGNSGFVPLYPISGAIAFGNRLLLIMKKA